MAVSIHPRNKATPNRRLPIGAEVVAEQGIHFRVFAPDASQLTVVPLDECGEPDEERGLPLGKSESGYHEGLLSQARAGLRYYYRIAGIDKLLPDPASRYQPLGPHGPSQVIDPSTFSWGDGDWPGVKLQGQVIYEMHIGTFTQEGTWAAASRELPELKRLGITLIEMMPVADFPGKFGWGYDGVNLFAPTRLYGKPNDLRSFVDQAHRQGIGVILDVVYNHLGPDGNYLPLFSESYFSQQRKTDWGAAINFDGPGNGPVREFFISNAGYWIEEFHFDGLRIDATQDVHDDSEEHVLTALTRHCRTVAGKRSLVIIGENEPQETWLIRPRESGGCGMDALWNDDFHHSAMVRISGRNEAYYTDYAGTPQEFVSAAKHGFLYQGQWYSWQKKPRGTSTRGLQPAQLVHYIQNHDQIANTALGQRAHSWTSPGCYRAMTALLLLGPQTPMLFQGQEFAASTPFYYFADHVPELAEKVDAGRREFMSQFPSIARPEVQAQLPDPADLSTFVRAKLQLVERQTHQPMYDLHRDLLRLRREDVTFSRPRSDGVDGAVLGDDAFALRFFGDQDEHDRLLLVNFDPDLQLKAAAEPLLAPPPHYKWELLWSSEDLKYGGAGTPPMGEGTWVIPGQAAVVLTPVPR